MEGDTKLYRLLPMWVVTLWILAAICSPFTAGKCRKTERERRERHRQMGREIEGAQGGERQRIGETETY